MEGASEGAVCAVSDSSNINGHLFLHTLKFFDKQLAARGVERPVLLILDGHFSHINGKVLRFAPQAHIDIFVLPSKTSHFTKPLDNMVFSALKREYAKF